MPNRLNLTRVEDSPVDTARKITEVLERLMSAGDLTVYIDDLGGKQPLFVRLTYSADNKHYDLCIQTADSSKTVVGHKPPAHTYTREEFEALVRKARE